MEFIEENRDRLEQLADMSTSEEMFLELAQSFQNGEANRLADPELKGADLSEFYREIWQELEA